MTTHEFYEIRIKGHLRPEWSVWFAGLTITDQPNGETVLAGPVTDQAALYGVLLKIRNLGLPLISINRVEPEGGGMGTAPKMKGEIT
jgi:hypothetical protein